MSLSRGRGLSETLRDVLSARPADHAFVAGDLSLSYGELKDRIGRTLNLFAAAGLGVSDRIVIACADDLETSVLYLAALRYGLTSAVIDPMSSIPEAILLMNAIQPSAVFMDEGLARDTLAAAPNPSRPLYVLRTGAARAPSVPGLIRVRKKDDALPGEDLALAREQQSADNDTVSDIPEDATALVLFTSGTTSRPKGVELTFGNLRAQFDTFSRHYGFDETTRLLNHLPLHHTDGLNQGPAATLFCGATWIRPSGAVAQNLGRLVGMVKEEAVTHAITVPTILALIDQLPAQYDACFDHDAFSFIGSTAGYLDETLWRRFENRFGVMVVNSYGLTETVSEALYCGPDEATRRVGSVGRPVDCEARIVDREGDGEGANVPVGATGELIIRGTNVLKGYLNDPDATAAVLKDGWFYSGDLAQRDEDGFFFIVGRKKNLIIRAGINVYPDDVTNAVMELDNVLEAATIGLSDSILGQKVVVCVTPAGEPEGLAERVAAHCKEQLAPERRPDHVLVFPPLPRGPSGKVILNELREMAARELEGPRAATEGTVEEQVLDIAASALGVARDSLGPETSSKTLEAWDSLAHLALISALEKQFSVKFGAEDIMSLSDLESAVALVSQKQRAGVESS